MQGLAVWHQTRMGLILFAAVEATALYIVASLAIDRGSIVWYLLTLIFTAGVVNNLVRLGGKLAHGHARERK